MTSYPKFLAILGAVVAILGLAFAGRMVLFDDQAAPGQSAALPTIGGPFSLTDHDGRPVTDADYRGQYMLVFFGYTYCPDVCPTALTTMAAAMERLPPEAEKRVTPLFISVDYERDTPEALKAYVSNFHPRAVGLTGSKEQVEAAAKAYRVYYAKAEQKDAPYLMDHSSIVYLMGPDGKFLTHFNHMTPPEQMAETVAKFVKAGAV